MKKPTQRTVAGRRARVVGASAVTPLRSKANRPALRVLAVKPAGRGAALRAVAEPKLPEPPVVAQFRPGYSRIDRVAAALVLLPVLVAVALLTVKPEGWSRGLMQRFALARTENSPATAPPPAATLVAQGQSDAARAAPAPAEAPASDVTAVTTVATKPDAAAPLYELPQSLDAIPSVPLAVVTEAGEELIADPPSDLIPAITQESEDFSGRQRRCELDDHALAPDVSLAVASQSDFGLALAQAALEQTRDFVVYSDRYKRLKFPFGDVSTLFGVCTDVIIRAYRTVGVDLQALVHAAGAGSGDRNIDHRRTEVLRRFFAGNGLSLAASDMAEDYLPGDVVSYHRPQNNGSQSHIAIVSNVIGVSGRPLIVHNRGWGPQLEDALFVDRITGHYRYTGGSIQEVAALRSRKGRFGMLRRSSRESAQRSPPKSFGQRRAALKARFFKSSVVKSGGNSSPGSGSGS